MLKHEHDYKNAYILKRWLDAGEDVIASIAPSYMVEFAENPERITGALKTLGFSAAEETITVLPEIIKKRQEIMRSARKPVIFNSCPAIRDLIETSYPKFKEHLCSLPTPMVLHARKLKQRFPYAKIVFIGPCLAKKWEQERFYTENSVDLVLTFREIRYLFKMRGIELNEQEATGFLSYPPPWVRTGVLIYYKSGIQQVTDFLNNWDSEESLPDGMELLACEGGCLNGQGMTVDYSLEERTKILENNIMRILEV